MNLYRGDWRGPCPRCARHAVVDIVYGYPTAEAMTAASRGAIRLGGNPFWLEDWPDFECLACGHTWYMGLHVVCTEL